MWVCVSIVFVSVCNSDFFVLIWKEEFCLGKNKILPPFTAEKLENGEIKQFGTQNYALVRAQECY